MRLIFQLIVIFMIAPVALAETVKLSIPLTNNNPAEASGIVHWMVTDGLTGKIYDYFSVCEEYKDKPVTKIGPGKTEVVSCTSSLLPSIETGPHIVAVYFAKSRTNTTYGSSEARLDCNRVGGTLRLSKCKEGEKEVDRASAFLGLQKCCISKGRENMDCSGEDCEIECIDTPGGCKKPKLTLIFLPINWKGTEQEYYDKVDFYTESVYNDFPLKGCKERIKIIKVPLKYGLNFDFASLDTCFEGRSSKTRQLVKNRLDTLGYMDRYDYGVGIYGDIIAGTCGFTDSDLDIIILTSCKGFSKDDRYTLSHELGHKAGLNDEYFDAVRCNLAVNANANRLLKELGGDIPINKEAAGFCAEGTKCLKVEEKDTPSQCVEHEYFSCEVDSSGSYSSCNPWNKGSLTCKGNKLGENLNERCIMSYSEADYNIEHGASRSGGFCQECQNFLKTVPQLKCDTGD